ncbi:unnamed protein product [Bemisia tabaci]|uniref:Uncharacterized protein n=1 Tax=Bemisia tabaci TaxID=7038 RepID=A0A9P0CFP3_BEMTA|nr:unnamed protein product [Bemisia tabaci]
MRTRPHQSIPRNINNQSSIGSIERMGDDIMKELTIRQFKIQMRHSSKDFIVFWKFKRSRILETDLKSSLFLLWSLLHLTCPQPRRPDLLITEFWHWLFIFTDSNGKDQLFHMIYDEDDRREKLLLETLDSGRDGYFRQYKRDPRKMVYKYQVPDAKYKSSGPFQRRERVERLGALSYTLALHLNGTYVYFDPLRCNCKHYVDYVVYGTTFGSWYSLSYRPINNKCPLARRVRSGMVVDSTFQLQSKRNLRGRTPSSSSSDEDIVSNTMRWARQNYVPTECGTHEPRAWHESVVDRAHELKTTLPEVVAPVIVADVTGA